MSEMQTVGLIEENLLQWKSCQPGLAGETLFESSFFINRYAQFFPRLRLYFRIVFSKTQICHGLATIVGSSNTQFDGQFVLRQLMLVRA